MTETNRLLAEYVGAGSETAFRELDQRYVNFVYSTAFRLVEGDRQLAEDVTQTVFADLAQAADKLSKNAKLGGWLHRHACFVAAKTMRGERRRRARERHAAEMNATPDHSAANSTRGAQELDEAINHLREADRTAILLRFFEQRDFRGVGQGLGIGEEAARKRVTRALEKLHKRLSRRGVTLPVAAVGALLAGEVVTSAPAEFAEGLAASVLAGAAAGTGAITTTKLMIIAKIKPVLLSLAALAVVTTPLVVQHRSEVALRRENESLRGQRGQLAQLQADNERPSNQLAQLRPQTSPPDEHRELLRLRGEVGLLRDHTNQLRAELATLRSQIAGGSSGPVRSPQGGNEVADIRYNFEAIPLSQILAIYEDLCGKKLNVASDVKDNQTVRIIAVDPPLTKSGALRVLENELRYQAAVMIVPSDDGTLSVVRVARDSGVHP